MHRIPIFLLFVLLSATAHAQSSRGQDEYEIGETGAPKDYDPAKDKPRDYDASKDKPQDYDPAKNKPQDFDPAKNRPTDYNETMARPHDYDPEVDKPKDYDPDYVEGIIWEPGAREAYRAKQDKRRPRPEPYGQR
jgi:hypothetical protein